MLALQLREQAAFDAEVLAVDAQNDYFRALADYRAATAADLVLPPSAVAKATSSPAPAPSQAAPAEGDPAASR
jgi:hypothetical protein